MKDMSREVSMLCPVCGNDQFESLDEQYPDPNDAPDGVLLKGSDCGATYTKEELFHENSEKIGLAVEDLKEEVAQEIEKGLKKAMKKWKL